MIVLVRLGYGFGRVQHTKKDPSAQGRKHQSKTAQRYCSFGHSLHADVVVRHWNRVDNIMETFPNGFVENRTPFEIWSSFVGSCNIH